jgi:hypothetical protein
MSDVHAVTLCHADFRRDWPYFCAFDLLGSGPAGRPVERAIGTRNGHSAHPCPPARSELIRRQVHLKRPCPAECAYGLLGGESGVLK